MSSKRVALRLDEIRRHELTSIGVEEGETAGDAGDRHAGSNSGADDIAPTVLEFVNY